MKLADFLTAVEKAGLEGRLRGLTPPCPPHRPPGVHEDRWAAMIKFYGTHYAVKAPNPVTKIKGAK